MHTSPAVTWHPVHPILVSGGSEGAILHWDIAAPEPTFNQPPAPPRATLSQAHDSNVWSLAFHPLGHLLVSASNDHTTRFWSRERPGDASSVFSGGGEKPPEIIDTSGQDDEDDAMVPGFSYSGGGGNAPWWGKDEETNGVVGSAAPSAENGFVRRVGLQDGGDDSIPGFGASDNSVAGRQSGPLPSQEDMFGGPEDWNRNSASGAAAAAEDWGRGGVGGGGAGNRQGRWGPRRGGGGGGRY